MTAHTSYKELVQDLSVGADVSKKTARQWLDAWVTLMSDEIVAGRSPIIGNTGMLYKHTRTKTNVTNPRTTANLGTKVIKSVRFKIHETLYLALN